MMDDEVSVSPFAQLLSADYPPLDELALALAAQFGPVDAPAALAHLDALASEVRTSAGTPAEQVDALVDVLARRHGFEGDREDYDHPDNSMLHVVLERRRGLPILLSVVYVEVARRAGIPLAGFGLPGHYVCGHVATEPPLLVDPFNDGARVHADVPAELVRPWGAHETILRMLNNLVAAYGRRGDLGRALRAAELRVALPISDAGRAQAEIDLRALRALLN